MKFKEFLLFCAFLATSVSTSTPPPLTPPPSSIFFELSLGNPEMTRDITYFISAVADRNLFLHFETFPMSDMTLKIYICEHILLTTTEPNSEMDVILGVLWVEHIIGMAQNYCSNGKYLMTAVVYSGIDQPVTVMFTRHPSFKYSAPENDSTKIAIPLEDTIADLLFPVNPKSLARNGSIVSTRYTVEMNSMVFQEIRGKGFIEISTDSTTPVTITWTKCGLASDITTQVDINEEVILEDEILDVLNMFKDTYCNNMVSHTTVELILTTHSSSIGTVTISFEKFDFLMLIWTIIIIVNILNLILIVHIWDRIENAIVMAFFVVICFAFIILLIINLK